MRSLSVSPYPQFSLYARTRLMFLECCFCYSAQWLLTSPDSRLCHVYRLHPGRPFSVYFPSYFPHSTHSITQSPRPFLQLRTDILPRVSAKSPSPAYACLCSILGKPRKYSRSRKVKFDSTPLLGSIPSLPPGSLLGLPTTLNSLAFQPGL